MNRFTTNEGDSLERGGGRHRCPGVASGRSMPSWPPLQGPKSIVTNDMGGGIHGRRRMTGPRRGPPADEVVDEIRALGRPIAVDVARTSGAELKARRSRRRPRPPAPAGARHSSSP